MIPSDKQSRVVGGMFATPGQFTYFASVQTQVPQYNGHFCGAAIIKTRWVLKAAHCMSGRIATDISIRVGSTTFRYG